MAGLIPDKDMGLQRRFQSPLKQVYHHLQNNQAFRDHQMTLNP